MTHCFVPFAFLSLLLSSLSNYKFLLLIEQIFHLIHLLLIQLFFLFFPLDDLIHNFFLIFCNVFINIIFLCKQWSCLYPFNTVWLFQPILDLHNPTKTNKLIFYLIPIFKVLNRQIYSFIFEFFNFYC